MDFNSNSQEKSTIVWSTPTSNEQKNYYSKHASERAAFGWITTLLQAVHAFLALAAWMAIFTWAFSKVPTFAFLILPLSLLAIFTLHILFRTTWQTYWYDKLDNDPNTDSPVYVPIFILILLLGTEIYGTREFLKNTIQPVAKTSSQPVDDQFAAHESALDAAYNLSINRIDATYAEKEKAAALPYDRQIRTLRVRRVSGDELKSVASQIRRLENQKTAAIAPVLAEKAAAKEKALNSLTEAKDQVQQRKTAAISAIDTQNNAEIQRYLSETGSVNGFAWLISCVLLALICALSYRIVRINVKSGIIPQRTYSALDAHGSAVQRIWTALADAFNRRSLQFSVYIHKLLSPKSAIASFDGTVVVTPGTYNTPQNHTSVENPVNDIVNESVNDFLKTGKPINPDDLKAKLDQHPMNYRPIGFYKRDEDGVNPVTQFPQPVTQQKEDNAVSIVARGNEVVKHYLSELQREPSHFKRPDAKPETVAGRINTKLDNAIAAISDLPMNSVLGSVTFKMNKFLDDTLIPVTRENGFDLHEKTSTLITVLNQKTVKRVGEPVL